MTPRPRNARTGATRRKVFEFVRQRILRGDPPTTREVQAHFGFKAVQSARQHLEALVAEGRLAKSPGKARGRGVGPGPDLGLRSSGGGINSTAPSRRSCRSSRSGRGSRWIRFERRGGCYHRGPCARRTGSTCAWCCSRPGAMRHPSVRVQERPAGAPFDVLSRDNRSSCPWDAYTA